ncbi:hypothetical protein NQ315_014700 [Exocentrus adspersus]|uniref:SWIM-type domain-containing protein n=1 Tax=Exocentrus adspersus TaxID=1586481 RepID=A0AAV8VR00_9CUCU|nr:hypothetical protein NQ315_014700 [Exocentrus adspersus]
MSNKLEEGYVQAVSDNLPKVDFTMVYDFFLQNADFLSAEMRNVKTDRPRFIPHKLRIGLIPTLMDKFEIVLLSYGDNAVHYVQLKRDGPVCTVKGKITPEHKIRKKAYTVCAQINELNESVTSCICLDCSASAGGCKHGVAFLMWLHRRSEDPSVTSVKCYWKKSALSNITVSKGDINSILRKTLG